MPGALATDVLSWLKNSLLTDSQLDVQPPMLGTTLRLLDTTEIAPKADNPPSRDTRPALVSLLAHLEQSGVVNLYLHVPQFLHLESATAVALREAYAACGREVPAQFRHQPTGEV